VKAGSGTNLIQVLLSRAEPNASVAAYLCEIQRTRSGGSNATVTAFALCIA
jgi:hypothetical protein